VLVVATPRGDQHRAVAPADIRPVVAPEGEA